MKEDLEIAVPEGGFKAVTELKGLPVLPEEVKSNIKASQHFDIPLLERSSVKQEGSFIFIAGGTSLTEHLDEIRERKNNGEIIATSNNTHDFLVENGIIPDICSMIDPKEKCKDYIKKPNKETRYIIAVVCNPAVFQNLIDADMSVEKMLVGYGLDNEEDVVEQMKIYSPEKAMSFLTGGTMMGLRAMNLAELLGYKKIEYYGMDSCFSSESPELVMEGDSRYEEILKKADGRHYEDIATGKKYVYDENLDGGFFYAYKKDRGEDIQIAETPDGRRFLTSHVFAHQAKQFVKWADRLEGKIDVVTHGDSLNSHMYKLHLENKRKAFERIGNKRWTSKHLEIQKTIDIKDSTPDIELISRPILALYAKLNRNIEVLDYGCGKGGNLFRQACVFNCINYQNYDPFIEEFCHEPEQADYTICANMLNFVEVQCIDNILGHIKSLTRYMLVITIRMDDASNSERTNYKTDRTLSWWQEKISQYFNIIEGVMEDKVICLVCQTLDASLVMERELNATTD